MDEPRGNILEWNEHDVHLYLTKLGYSQYEAPIRDHHITGDILIQLDADTLKEIGITTIGQRLAILKAVYQVKVAQGIEIEAGHYVPPSEADVGEPLTVNRLHDTLKEQGERLKQIEEENRRLSECLNQCMEEVGKMASLSSGRSSLGDDRTLHDSSSSYRWAPSSFRGVRSPTRPDSNTTLATESPHPSPQKSEYDLSNGRAGQATPTPSLSSNERGPTSSQRYASHSSAATLVQDTTVNQSHRQVTSRQDAAQPPSSISASTDNLKSFKVSLDDPAWKVLPAALKKYKINNDDWQNYAMFICYGQTERCLSYDEKPLLLFQKLKDAKKNPVFMLKHIRDIRSPIIVAQQKHAARKASESNSGSGRSQQSHSRSVSRPVPKINANTPPLATSTTVQSSWPELMSPAVEHKDKLEESMRAHASGAAGAGENDNAEHSHNAARQDVVATGISYAVAIYPYMAEQDDEFDVVVGDTFIILSRARGWWVVQRDQTGNGILDTDTTRQGWVPAGCLLETNVPVASAIAEANAARASANGSPPPSPTSKTPILPLSILSTSFPGVALMDYRAKGEEELNLVKDDLLRVFKRYNHWSYAVKEDGGDRGWVPSWFIGKVASAGQVPSTPSTAAPVNGSAGQQMLDSEFRYAGMDGGSAAVANQVSPMSSAFPPQSSRTIM